MAKGATKSRLPAWVVSDDFWQRVEPLIPERRREVGKEYVRKAGGGRKPKDPRLVFEAIVYVLRTGCQWKALPSERFGSPSAIHKRFLEWQQAGVFEALWKGEGTTADAVIEAKGLKQISDSGAIEKIVEDVLARSAAQIAEEEVRRTRHVRWAIWLGALALAAIALRFFL
jgi:transposase